MATEIKKIISRRDTAAKWEANNPILAQGEIGVDTTNKVMKIGDGVTPWKSLKGVGGVEIVNDLTTGGADKALSAEMGKELVKLGHKYSLTDNDVVNKALSIKIYDNISVTRIRIWKDSSNRYVQLFDGTSNVGLITIGNASMTYPQEGMLEMVYGGKKIGLLALNPKFDFSTISSVVDGNITYGQYDYPFDANIINANLSEEIAKLDSAIAEVDSSSQQRDNEISKAQLLLEELNLPIKIEEEPINAIAGFVVDSKSQLSDVYIAKTSTGSIEAVFNESAFNILGATNVVLSKLTSTLGSRNAITIFIPKENMIKAGANFDEEVRVSAKFNMVYDGDYVVPMAFMALRYGEGDKSIYNTSIDVLVSSNGSIAGLGSGDTTTWADLTTTANINSSKDIIKFKKFENVIIPANYKGKDFVGVLMIMFLSKYSAAGYAEQIFASPALIIGTAIDEQKDYKNVAKNDTLAELDNRIAEAESNIQNLDNRLSLIEESEDEGLPNDIYIADIGSSFCHANHTGVDIIEDGDPYMPIDGYEVSIDTGAPLSTYKRKSHMYYIAKKNKLKWANYGYGGTTLVHCAPKAYPNRVFFPLVDERKEQLKEGIDWDYICITLGGNDISFGPIYMRDLWLQETYGQDIGYPVNDSQVGAEGFATAEQKAACDAITGEVFGKNYEDNTLYFMAKFLGTKNSTDPNTYWGAWNIVLPYFMAKYKKAKIVIIDPLIAGYGERAVMMKEVISEVAKKWGVNFFDFNRLNWFYGQVPPNYSVFPNPNREDGMWERPDGTLMNGTVFSYITCRMSYDGQHPTNLGYQKLAGPIGNAILNE